MEGGGGPGSCNVGEGVTVKGEGIGERRAWRKVEKLRLGLRWVRERGERAQGRGKRRERRGQREVGNHYPRLVITV